MAKHLWTRGIFIAVITPFILLGGDSGEWLWEFVINQPRKMSGENGCSQKVFIGVRALLFLGKTFSCVFMSLGVLVQMKGNSMLTTLWKQIEEEPEICVMVRCLQQCLTTHAM